jgi:DNA-directed RNA polymerase specialized sigma24 family protein
VRDEDVSLAEQLAAGQCNSPEARAWIARFNAMAMAHCARFGHSFQDAEDLVQGFWLWVYAKAPARVFSRYSPDRSSLLSFALACIRHAVARPGRRLADLRRLWDVLDEELAVPAGAPSSLDVLLENERKERAVRDPMETEALRRVDACLTRLGRKVGEQGWLLCQLHVRRRKYSQLAAAVFGRHGTPAQRKRQLGALRKRAFHASQRFVRFLAAERDATSAATPDRGSRTATSRLRISSDDATRLLSSLGVACFADSRLADESLLGHAYGDLPAADRSRVKQHLKECPYCSEQATHLRKTIEHFETPAGRERLGRLWASFREASTEMMRDAGQPGRRGTFAAAARAHEGYRSTLASQEVPTWAALTEDLKLSNYHQVLFAKHLLRSAGLSVSEARGRQIVLLDLDKKLGEATVRRLAELEHERFVAERTMQGWRYGKTKDVKKKRSPYLVAWDQLTPDIQDLDVRAVRALPETLREQGFEVSCRRAIRRP